jgi:hypothetical protein
MLPPWLMKYSARHPHKEGLPTMKFYKSITIPCTVSIPQVQDAAQAKGITLLACNSADITDLCQEEREYLGPESQTLLFWLHASSEDLASQQLEELTIDLLRLSYVVGTALLADVQRSHAHIYIATDSAFNQVSALIDRLGEALSDLEDGYSLACVEGKHFVVSAATQDELGAMKSQLAHIDGVTLL